MEKDKYVTIHKRNLRALIIEMYKIHHKFSLSFVIEFVVKVELAYNTISTTNVALDANNVRNNQKFFLLVPNINIVFFGKEFFRWLGPILWNTLPEEAKHTKFLEVFKQRVKSLTFDQCPSNLCREYIHDVGYTD